MSVDMWVMFAQDLMSDSYRLTILFTALSLSAASWIWMRRVSNVRTKLTLLRAHLVLLFSPLLFLAFTWKCGMSLSACSPHVILLSVPSSVFLTYIAGVVLVPKIYAERLGTHRLEKTLANRLAETKLTPLLGITPSLYTIDTAEPIAFVKSGRKPSMYLSIGLMELLTPKELEAVMLHEAYHIRVNSPILKFSSLFSRIVSPFRWFETLQNNDEKDADSFAIRVQRTSRYIRSARQKILQCTNTIR